MCPQRVCRECGWPSERVTLSTHDQEKNGQRRTLGAAAGWNTNRADGGGGPFTPTISTTVGFTDCGHDNYRNGVAFDPFGGSGTTAVAAALEGRDAILIDLDQRNVDLTRRRLTDKCRILDETRDGDTWTWTVQPLTPDQLAGKTHREQIGLFDGEPA
jgi:hypothetical protein